MITAEYLQDTWIQVCEICGKRLDLSNIALKLEIHSIDFDRVLLCRECL